MRIPRFEYLRPASLEECLAVLDDSGQESRILAGGTDLLGNLKYGVITPRQVVSIRSLPELCSVSEDGEGNLRIGACANLSDLVKHPVIGAKYPALRDAIHAVGSVHIRNMATLGGNICLSPRCWYYNQSRQWRKALAACHRIGGSVCHAISGSSRCHAINSSDTAPVLIALGAKVCLRKKDRERWIPVRDFLRDDGNHHTLLEAGEILISVLIPGDAAKKQALFIKVQLRKGLDFAIGSIAAVRGKGGDGEVTLVMNSLGSAPLILEKASQVIRDSGFDEAALARAAAAARGEMGIVTNLFTSAGYKRRITEVLVKQALSNLKQGEKKGGKRP